MEPHSQVVHLVFSIIFLTLFLDVLELSFSRVLWFIRTLRFWLYFLLHFVLSCIAAVILSSQIDRWYILGPLATFLGVSVLSNMDVKVAGHSLAPIGQLFVSIKAKMFEQAAEEKAAEIVRAQLIERLVLLTLSNIESIHAAGLMGADQNYRRTLRRTARALESTGSKNSEYKLILINELIKVNSPYVEKNIDRWELENALSQGGSAQRTK